MEQEKKKGFYIQTFGCQMNVADSDRMKANLVPEGYQEITDPTKADLVVINTCSVREKAENKTGTFANHLKELKRQKPEMILGVTGCVAQQEGEKIIEELPFVDFVLGPDNVDELPWALDQISHTRAKKIVRTEFDADPRVWNYETKLLKPGPSAFINIMKGCDHFCSYCIVPMTRGREKSRPMADVLEDVKRMTAQGVKEFYFLGQNINSYGKRAGETLHELFYRVHEIPEVKRIRFTTSHPGDLRTELINAFRDLPKLCSYFHLPFQSGSDRILRSMRRFYTRESYMEKAAQLREARPDIAISTDVIVGFPGETEEDFEQTMDLVRNVTFDNGYSFLFSPRPGTSASKREDTTPVIVKKERLHRLQELLRSQSLQAHKSFEGKTVEVMIEGISKRSAEHMTARSSQNVPVHFKHYGKNYTAGDFVNIAVAEATVTSLHGSEHSNEQTPTR